MVTVQIEFQSLEGIEWVEVVDLVVMVECLYWSHLIRSLVIHSLEQVEQVEQADKTLATDHLFEHLPDHEVQATHDLTSKLQYNGNNNNKRLIY